MSLSHSPTGKMGCAKMSLVCSSHTTPQIDKFCRLCRAKPEDCDLAHRKVSFENMELLWEAIKYEQYQCLFGNVKIIGLLMDKHECFKKYCSFDCV